MDIKLFVAAKACILNKDNQLLLVRESNSYLDASNVGKWDIPGGRLDVSETLKEGLLREVREEVGLSVTSYDLFDVHDTFVEKNNERWHIVRLFYKVSCDNTAVKLSTDHDAYAWIDLDKVIKHPGFIQNMIPTVEKLIKQIENN